MDGIIERKEACILNDKNTDWNDRLEKVIKNIGESSKSYKLMHIHEAQRTTKIYNTLMILGIIMGPLSGIVTGIGEILNPNTEHVFPIITTVISFLAGTIVAVVKFGKYDESSNANKQAAARYTSIESNVRRQLSLYREDRIAATPYMKWLETKYDELFLSAPLLPVEVYNKYSVIAKNLGLEVPVKYEPIININTEYENTKMEEIVNITDINVNEDEKSITEEIVYNSVPDIEIQETISDKQIKRRVTMSQFPELNECSDKMLQYEMKRMMGFV